MAIQWFCQREGRPSGPVDSRELRRLAETGIVTPSTLVRKGANGHWVRAENVRGLFQQSTPAASPSLGTTPPGPPPLSSPVPESGASSRGISDESPIRHSLDADERRVPCPVCCEAILPGAKKCRFCGEILSEKPPAIIPNLPPEPKADQPSSITSSLATIPLLRKDMLAMSVITGLSVTVSIIKEEHVLGGVFMGLIYTPFAWCGWFLILALFDLILAPFKKQGS